MGILRRSHCAFAISPIHQPDDECKKPHYHVVFYSGNGPITLQAAKSKIPAEVPANDYVEITASSSGYQRYLIHLDDPEKEQFPEGINAITLINGFPLDLSKSEKAKIRLELMRIIRENGVTEYCDFVFWADGHGRP